MRIIFTIGTVILLTSCATSNEMSNNYTQTVQSWRGGTVKNLVQRWGVPDMRLPGRDGSVLYVYKTENSSAYRAPSATSVGIKYTDGKPVLVTKVNNTNNTWNRALSSNCVVGFETNNGLIVGTQIQGSGCYGSAGFAARMTNPHSVG